MNDVVQEVNYNLKLIHLQQNSLPSTINQSHVPTIIKDGH